MADLKDAARATSDADDARLVARHYGAAIEDGRTSDPSLAVLLAAEAICAEIRAAVIWTDYNARLDRHG